MFAEGGAEKISFGFYDTRQKFNDSRLGRYYRAVAPIGLFIAVGIERWLTYNKAKQQCGSMHRKWHKH